MPEQQRPESIVKNNEAARSKLLETARCGEYSQEQMRRIIKSRFAIAQRFTDFLAGILKKLNEITDSGERTEAVKKMVQKNLSEETAENGGTSHEVLRKRLLSAVGALTEESELKLPEEGEGYHNGFMQIIETGSVPRILGAFFARELFATIEYEAYRTGIKLVFPEITSPQVAHLTLHESRDHAHAQEVFEVITLYPEAAGEVYEGVQEGMGIINRYLQEMKNKLTIE